MRAFGRRESAIFAALSNRLKIRFSLLFATRILVRLLHLRYLGFEFDTVQTQHTWAKNAFDMGVYDFWRDYTGFFDYLPGSLYLLTVLEAISRLFGNSPGIFVATLKLFNVVVDCFLACMVIGVGRRYGKLDTARSYGLGLTTYLVPSLWFVSVVYGQFDSLIVVFGLGAVLLLFAREETPGYDGSGFDPEQIILQSR